MTVSPDLIALQARYFVFEPIGFSGEPRPEPELPIGCPLAEWPTPAPAPLTVPDDWLAPGAVFEPVTAELFCAAAVALGPLSEGSEGTK
jgi:hypothetical protein